MAPIQITDSSIDYHVLVSRKDFGAMLWSVMSFYRVSSIKPKLFVHADPTVTRSQVSLLESCFPGVTLLPHERAAEMANNLLADYPLCRTARHRGLMARKFFDCLLFGSAEERILADSDVLFFQDPREITRQHEGMNTFLEDHWSSYLIPRSELQQRTGIEIPERINAGFGRLNIYFATLGDIESTIERLPELQNGQFGFDQLLLAILCTKSGLVRVGGEYRMLPRKEEEAILIHYTSVIRHKMYTDGIPFLAKRYGL
ncbi:MAG: hypothetical protein CMJ47_03810 [Planctomyces sp.]|nr:hypothetical protein [Planctomyces sp.]